MAVDVGERGEELAEKYLRRKGFVLVDRRFKTPRWGEIDLIMRDGDTTVFVEVKTRSSGSKLFGGPLGSLHYHKLKTLQRAVQYYLSSQRLDQEAVRIDAVTVILPEDEPPQIKHYTDVTSSLS